MRFASNLQNHFPGLGNVFGLSKGNRFWPTYFTPFKCGTGDIITATVIISVSELSSHDLLHIIFNLQSIRQISLQKLFTSLFKKKKTKRAFAASCL